MKWMKNRPVVGIAFDGQRMSAALVTRAGGQAVVKRQAEEMLTLDPLTGELELVGQEIQNVLQSAGIRETRCVMCVPLKWALTTQCEVPELSGEDLQGFLDLHAEREFPFPPHDLCTSVSHFTLPGGTRGATIVAISATHEALLENLAKAAGLRLVGITAGLTELAPPSEDAPRIDLHVQESGVSLQISAGGGVVALRSLEEVMEDVHGRAVPDAEAILRQLRITAGQLPLALQNGVNRMHVYGSARLLDACLPALETAAAERGIEVVRADAAAGLSLRNAPDLPGPAVLAAAHRVMEGAPVFELMPPHTTQLQRIAAHMSARSALWLGTAAAAVLVSTGASFWWQGHTLNSLDARWEAIRADVERVEALQEKIRLYRPWCNDDVQSLNILHCLAASFPAQGDVWAQSVVITSKDQRYEVLCTSSARGSDYRLELSDRLRVNDSVNNLLAGQVRGDSPEQFSFRFDYKETANAL